ncbi:hypothetical protein ACE14D_08110 [Streptomyces sp. Act-28]
MVLVGTAPSSDAIRDHLRKPVSGSRRTSGTTGCGAELGGGVRVLDREAHMQRGTVERRVNRLEQWRGIAIRYERTVALHLAGLRFVSVFLWSAR